MAKVEAIVICRMIQDIKRVHILGLQATVQRDPMDILLETVGLDMDITEHLIQVVTLTQEGLEAVSTYQYLVHMVEATIQTITATLKT
ncbi:MAG: hypothetical protein JWP09_763 [Candidatus Taylorbacteria bacterium]|nr:hypothetical protein [Candidatus Taylorbacteria bacterium]